MLPISRSLALSSRVSETLSRFGRTRPTLLCSSTLLISHIMCEPSSKNTGCIITRLGLTWRMLGTNSLTTYNISSATLLVLNQGPDCRHERLFHVGTSSGKLFHSKFKVNSSCSKGHKEETTSWTCFGTSKGSSKFKS